MTDPGPTTLNSARPPPSGFGRHVLTHHSRTGWFIGIRLASRPSQGLLVITAQGSPRRLADRRQGVAAVSQVSALCPLYLSEATKSDLAPVLSRIDLFWKPRYTA